MRRQPTVNCTVGIKLVLLVLSCTEIHLCEVPQETSFVLPLDEAKRGLKLLKEAGMEKVNFSGGEPFITEKGRYVGELVRYCKQSLDLPSVSIVSNGSLITEEWFQEYGAYMMSKMKNMTRARVFIVMMNPFDSPEQMKHATCSVKSVRVSGHSGHLLDSFNEATNIEIGRRQGNTHHVNSVLRIKQWCHSYKVAFKINTVVNTFNWEEDMSEEILNANPVRWKVFQCLLIEGENVGAEAKRNAERFVVSKEQFESFLKRHKSVPQLVPESNVAMRDSYLILDEYMRFLDCTKGRKDPSKSILDVGVADAMKFSGFDEAMFKKRGGVYNWSKADMRLDW
eukprot:Em0002g191a